ncbi:uncharacterized protein LOC133300048 [Gastrolobium bilobum]|uniref:uncharacterized protein LOC133300048 n=1 Tax=Gastrolobium bilobum TaxID=150636 RepID=UPI002AB096A9|nr:uncharacterized protein LOC133300048 [Gastrolobium bilobum]
MSTLLYPRIQPIVLEDNGEVSFRGDAIKSTESSGSIQGEKEGITVTWEDLWVTVSNGKKRKPILQGLTGQAQPGRLLAIMGPSGCGKSTFLDALAGRLSSNLKRTGNILINGHKQALAYGTSGYVTQDDAMLSNLTAGETLYYSAQLQFPDSMSIAEKKERAEMTLREMGLQDAINTKVGGWGAKGLSGGQKRRLSICIEILTRPRLLFLDEPTSGLDSAASYYVMRRIASLNLRDGILRTIVTSIHQPSSEVFELFHDLCLLSSGETVYFGPASDANQFFALNGFPCPTHHNPSDHYLRIINKDFEQDAEEGFGKGATTEEAISILVKSYGSSQIRNKVKMEVVKISESDSGAIGKKGIHAAFLTQCLVLIRRSSLQLFRDISNYWLRLSVFIVIAISIGSIFYHIGSSNESIQGRGSLLTFFISVLSFMNLIGGFSPLLEEMKVFERERLNGHYGITAFLIGNILSVVPYMLMISLIPGGIAYYLCGLHKGLENFMYFTSLLFAIMMWVESLMLVVGSVSPNYVIGMFIAGGIAGLMILTGGFYRLPNDIPKPLWKYPLYYVSFLKYAFQGSFKNEFEGLTFSIEQDGGTKTISGRQVLIESWHVEMGHSKWVDLAIMFAMIVLYRVLFLAITKSKEKLKPSVPKNTAFLALGENFGEKEGITVTWDDLCVTVSNGKKRKTMLQGLTGYALPGRLLAIMGPSGSGKSTFLDALAGRLSSNIKRTGNILINGHKQVLAYGTSGYVTQDAAMLSNLTAGETLYYSAQLQFPDSMSIAEKKERAEMTLREMGLQDAINTKVGGWGDKGLSGGQKRRLSICIEILTRPRLLFLDEPTSGLDSAASYYVMRRIASLNLRDGILRTIVTSIHQPSSEVFELFHDLCLLSSGETVYFGPAPDANQFFSSKGFPCPTHHNPSDHYLTIINKDFEQDATEGFATTEEAIGILVNSYGSSQIGNKVKKEVAKISESDSGAIGKKGIHAAFLTQCLVLIRRSSLQLFRDISNYWLRLSVFIVIAISIGSIFYHIGSSNESIQGRGSLLTFFISVLTFMNLVGGFSPLLEEMKVFERERLNGHYGITVFLIGNILSVVPYMLMISLIPGGIAYYLCGLHKGLENFMYFTSLLFAIMMWVESLMLVVGSVSPNYVIGMFIAGGIAGLMILTGGFYRLPNDIPKPLWKYPLYYVSFLKYAFQGSFKNEFEGLTFSIEQDGGTKTISGRQVLIEAWHVEMGHSKWVDLAIMFAMIVLYRVLFLAITKSKEKLKPSVVPKHKFSLELPERVIII